VLCFLYIVQMERVVDEVFTRNQNTDASERIKIIIKKDPETRDIYIDAGINEYPMD